MKEKTISFEKNSGGVWLKTAHLTQIGARPALAVRSGLCAGSQDITSKCAMCKNNCEYHPQKYACLSECDLIC